MSFIRFLLFWIDQPISLTERFKLVSQRIEGDLDNVLIITTSHTIFHPNIEAHNQGFNFSVDTMVDNQSSRLVQIVSNLAAAVNIQSRLTLGELLHSLQVFNRLQRRMLFVEPLVNRFKFAPIHDKGCPLVSTQVAKLSSPKSIAKGLSLTISTASSSPSEKCTQLGKIEHHTLGEFSLLSKSLILLNHTMVRK